VKVSWTDLLL